jgi:hypothetical protein
LVGVGQLGDGAFTDCQPFSDGSHGLGVSPAADRGVDEVFRGGPQGPVGFMTSRIRQRRVAGVS